MSRMERNSPARSTSGLMLIGLRRSGKRPVSCGAVVLLDVLARAGDGQQVEQLEVVEPQHVHEPGRAALGLFQGQPAVELKLRLANRRLDAGNAMVRSSAVSSPSVTKAIWFLQVGQAVVDRRGREHEHAGLDALLDDPPHQAVVAGLAVLVRGLVAEVVRLVDDHQVVVAPVDVGQVDVAGQCRRRGRGRCG